MSKVIAHAQRAPLGQGIGFLIITMSFYSQRTMQMKVNITLFYSIDRYPLGSICADLSTCFYKMVDVLGFLNICCMIYVIGKILRHVHFIYCH